MGAVVMDDRVRTVLARLEQAEDDLAGLDLELCSDDVDASTQPSKPRPLSQTTSPAVRRAAG
jgi:hypothetical protein